MSSMGRRSALSTAVATVAAMLSACSGETPRKSEKKAEPATSAVDFTVAEQQVDDLKAVLATVRSKKVVEARVRTPGTVAAINVVEGAHVEPGQVLGVVVDPKIAFRIKASEAQIVALKSKLVTAKAELDRTVELQRRGVAPQARLDQARTAFDVATNDLGAARADRSVIEKQVEEGQVLAPAKGRVLRVPVTEGTVVLAGESIASIAANEYLLRLEVPERHARFTRVGDTIKVGGGGLGSEEKGKPEINGRIVQVYPEIQSGRVVADAEVPELGSYFVGERVLAWISTGKRKTFIVPRDLVFERFGVDYVRLASASGAPLDVVVQLGQDGPQAGGTPTVEVLAGVNTGDRLVQP